MHSSRSCARERRAWCAQMIWTNGSKSPPARSNATCWRSRKPACLSGRSPGQAGVRAQRGHQPVAAGYASAGSAPGAARNRPVLLRADPAAGRRAPGLSHVRGAQVPCRGDSRVSPRPPGNRRRPAAISAAWRPYRMWMTFLLRQDAARVASGWTRGTGAGLRSRPGRYRSQHPGTGRT